MSAPRTLFAVLVLLLAGVVARTGAAPVPVEEAGLDALPYAIGTWQGADAEPADAETLRILAADAVLTRTYTAPGGPDPMAGLYIAYYAKQRPGVSVHSPLHCLPGTGWEPLEVSTLSVTAADGSIGTIRRMLVRKQRERALVFYWYGVHGRTIASEVASKLTLLADSVRLRRSDASLVRIVVPVAGSVESAERTGLQFVRDLMPHARHIGD